jgi:ferritin-like metal-binding protein YciE
MPRIMKAQEQGKAGLRKLLEEQLADMYYAEKQLVRTLPKMAKAAKDKALAAAFESHLMETRAQVERLEQVFKQMDMPAKGKTCPAILGLLQEGSELMEEFARDDAADAALMAAAQKVEHYEIASYGSMCAWADHLGLEKVAALLRRSLEEEQAADEKLSGLAEDALSHKAAEHVDQSDGLAGMATGSSVTKGETGITPR